YGTVHPGDRIEPRTLALFSTILAGSVDALSLSVDGQPCELPAEVAGCAGLRLRILGRLPDTRQAPASVMLKAVVAGEPWQCEVPVVPLDSGLDPGAIAHLWAREKVSALLDATAMMDSQKEAKALLKEATDCAVRHGILTPVTSMVLIDDEGEKVGGSALFQDIPVALPHGWG
ncbi:MAG: hypothetical protein N3A02_03285, partial [Rectinema sp.]|nr:hypothetical protein [Rectinema sp.]